MPRGNNESFDHLKPLDSSLKYIHDNTTNGKVKILYNHLPLSIVVSFVCASVIFFSLNNPMSIFEKIWYAAVIVISIFRFALILIHKTMPFHPKVDLMFFTIGAALSASCWGVIGSFLMPDNNLFQQMIIIIIISGVSAGAMQTLQANLISAILFLLLSILPLSIWLFSQGVFEYYVLGIVSVTFLLFCGLSAFRGNRLINQVLTLNFKNLHLASRLYTSNDELINKNSQLQRHEQDMNIINHMNEKLQLCKNSAEAHLVIKIAAEQLFIDFLGGLTINDSLGNQILVAQWGDKKSLETKFSSDACWGIRDGAKYLVNEHHIDLFCKHYIIPPKGSYCIPLIVDNNLLGMINFNFSNQSTITNYSTQIMTVFGDAVKSALANIQLREKLQVEATRDPLTNLFNRRYLNETLSREFHRIIREKNSLCFVMLDLDHFKSFNDSYGHEAGDEILKYVGTLLINKVRGSDIACRFGGEEFALVFINTTIDEIITPLEHIRNEIENAKIYFRDTLLPPITTSMGIAQAPVHGTTIKELIQAADMALYAAKRSGRNKIMTSQSSVPPPHLL